MAAYGAVRRQEQPTPAQQPAGTALEENEAGLFCVDALAGCGLRSLRLALEVKR